MPMRSRLQFVPVPAAPSRTNNSTPASGSSNSTSSDARPTPRPSPTTLPTATERHDHAGNDVESQAPNVGIIPICPPSSSSSNCRPTNSVVPVADSPSPPSPAPMTPRSWRSKSAPTVGCIGGGGIGPPAPVWVTVLLDKFLFYRPPYRLLEDLATQGLDLSQGTLTDGLLRLLPLFEPLYDQLVQHSQEQTLWHADETRWLVFATWDGKVGYRWYLW